MKKLHLLLAVLVCSTALYAQSPTDPALGFNMFLEEDGYLKTNETEGPVAMGRNLWLKGNYQVSTNHAGTFKVGGVTTTLVVGNKVKYYSGNSLKVNKSGYVKIGNCKGSCIWYKDQNNAYSPIRITKNNYYNCTPYIQLQANALQLGVSYSNNPVCQSNVIDFGAAFTALKNNSLDLSRCAHSAQLTNANGTPLSGTSNLPNQVKINLSTGKNVLNIKGSEMNDVQVFTYNQKPNATRYLIINVDASGSFDWDVWNQAGVGFQESKYIIYNFYNTTTLKIKGNSTVQGTILAPYAYIEKTVNQSNIEGQVIAKSFYHSGGELHYAPFEPSEQGCGNPTTPTVADFQTADSTVCFEENSLYFSNNSTGPKPLTFTWNFGDGNTSTSNCPIHSYSSPGTYQVQLIVNSNGGSDTIVKTVQVLANPNALFSVNDTIQDSSSNAFVFTALQNNSGDLHRWTLGDGNMDLAAIVNHSYANAGAYNVEHHIEDSFGCESTFSLLVTVENDSTSSGNDGGLESHSLEGLVSSMNFNKRKQSSAPFNFRYANAFVPAQSSASRNGGSPRLEKYFPTSLRSGGQSYKSSPTQLLGITNAEEITSVDYVQQNRIKASTLATITSGKPYSHTKYTCDRFLNSELTYLASENIQGIDFILFALKRHNDLNEYGMEFSIGYNSGDAEFSIQTNWLIDEYSHMDSVYNFQVWATNPKVLVGLVEDILLNFKKEMNIKTVQPFATPKVYVTKGYRKEGKLHLTIKNTTSDPYITAQWVSKRNEMVQFDTTLASHLTQENGEVELSFQVDDEYEFDIYFFLNDRLEDKVYMADANWGLDYDRNFTTVDRFEVSNASTHDYKDKLPLYRNVSLKSNTADYITLYKDLTAGTLPTDVSAYKGLSFYAEGEGSILLRLFSSDITNWRSQFTTTVELDPNGKLHQIDFSAFKSDSISGAIPTENLITLGFTYESKSFDYEDIEYELSRVAFVKEFEDISTVSIQDLNATTLFKVFPNPNSGKFAINFDLKQAEAIEISVQDLLGRTVYQSTHNGLEGHNHLNLDLDQVQAGQYLIRYQSENGETESKSIVIQ